MSKLRKTAVLILVLTMCAACSVPSRPAWWPNDTASPETDNHGSRPAAEQKVRVLNWLTHMPARRNKRIASGHFGGYSSKSFSLGETEQIARMAGRPPAILGCDYAALVDPRTDTPVTDPLSRLDYSCNRELVRHWRAGGLVTVSIHFPSPGNASGGGLNQHLYNFRQLFDASTDTGLRWRRFLDKTADGLKQLREAGVPVLFRPLHEMNTDAFWWSNQNVGDFRGVWQSLYRYLTDTKHLDNLIWVYAPDAAAGRPTRYYPGDQYVDVAGLDAYSDNPATVRGYSEMVALGKPFAFTEIGPARSFGSFDYTRWRDAILDRFPAATYIMTWNDRWGPTRNRNGDSLFKSDWLVHRGEIDLTTVTEDKILHDFEKGTDGWKAINASRGPSSGSLWSASGHRSLMADIELSAGDVILSHLGEPGSFVGKHLLRCTVHHAAQGTYGAPMEAKLFFSSHSRNTWLDGGTIEVPDSSEVTLTFALEQLPDIAAAYEFGVLFRPAAGSRGASTVFVDSVVTEHD